MPASRIGYILPSPHYGARPACLGLFLVVAPSFNSGKKDLVTRIHLMEVAVPKTWRSSGSNRVQYDSFTETLSNRKAAVGFIMLWLFRPQVGKQWLGHFYITF